MDSSNNEQQDCDITGENIGHCKEEGPCYDPIETLEDLLSYGSQVPQCTLVKETIPLADNFSDIKIQVNGRRFKRNSCPKTLVCHDFKGGYLDDKYINGTRNPQNYIFRHWLQTDIFCYFSHKFVSIPPLGWINAAHQHGVQIIGTIITESDDGKLLCQKLLKDAETIRKAVEKLCLVAKHYQFDGYLVNIENEIENTAALTEFLQLLTIKMKEVVPKSLVLWYDSVCVDGSLKWQNELNSTNKVFFDSCDGIYLNYGWNQETCQSSLEAAEDREFDVYVGIDVFGRGCFGGGGLNTWQSPFDPGCKKVIFASKNGAFTAVEKVASCRLSIAIFAPGWTFETHEYENFPIMDDQLWNRCAKYYFFRTLASKPSPCLESEQSSQKVQVLVSTDFDQGFGKQRSFFGKAYSEGLEDGKKLPPGSSPWFDLNEQSYQPVLNCFRSSEGNPYGFEARFDTSFGFLGGGSLKISSQIPFPTDSQIDPACPIWIPLNISLRETMESSPHLSKCAIVTIVAWRMTAEAADTDNENPIKIFIDFMKPTICTRKVIRLSNLNDQIAFEKPENPIVIHFKDFIPKKYSSSYFPDCVNELKFSFSQVPYAEENMNGWTISCFLMDVNHCVDWNCTAFRLGASRQNVSVGLLSLGLVNFSS